MGREWKRNRVVVCFIRNNGKILLLKRSRLVGSYKGKWHAVAGYIEKGEKPEQTAWKEIREEVRIPKRSLKLLRAGKPLENRSARYGCVWEIHPFLFESSTRRVKTDWEHTERRWIKPRDMGRFDIVPGADKSLERALHPVKVIAMDFAGVYFSWSDERHVENLARATKTSKEAVRRAFLKGLKKYQVSRISEREYWNIFCNAVGKKISHRRLTGIVLSQFKPVARMTKLAERLRRHYHTILLTNHTSVLDKLNERYGFYSHFDKVISSHRVRLRKPNRGIFMLLMRRAKARPEEILFIDDLARNTKAAEALGIRSIVFKSPGQLERELARAGIRY